MHLIRTLLLATMLGLVVLPAWAHKLRVFAVADGQLIQGTVYFAGGAPALGVRIRVQDAGGRLLAEPVSDAKGAFSYRAEAAVDHLVIAETGDGHRAQWRVGGAELAPGFPGAVVLSGALEQSGPAAAPGDVVPVTAAVALDSTQIAAIEQAVARQIRPLREELNAARDQVAVRDILGGIGYIFGLTGLALWWRARREGRGR